MTQLRDVYHAWNNAELNSYLIEITSHIFSKKDEKTGKQLIDEILAVAKQNGTGMWTSQSAMELQVPVPTIDLAVTMRDLSVFVKEREQASALYQRPIQLLTIDHTTFHKTTAKCTFYWDDHCLCARHGAFNSCI